MTGRVLVSPLAMCVKVTDGELSIELVERIAKAARSTAPMASLSRVR